MIRVINALFLTVCATILTTSALVIYLPFDRGDTLIWTGLMVPLLWVVAIVYIYWIDSSWRGLAVMGGLIIISSLLILFSGDQGGVG